MSVIDETELRNLVRREIAESARDTSARARQARERAAERLRAAEQLRVEMRELLERAREDLRAVVRGLESVETRFAREARERSDQLRDVAKDARASGGANRGHADAAKARSESRRAAVDERAAQVERSQDEAPDA